jgi:hypothetical protein
MMGRDRLIQSDPNPELDWQRFPVFILEVDQDLFRIHSAKYGVWFFSAASTDGGRFDLDAPRGTCYTALDWMSAVLEKLGEKMAGAGVGVDFFTELRLSRIHAPGRADLAELSHGHAAGFGVTNELSSMTPYDMPRRWAAHFDSHGFSGVRYHTRFNPKCNGAGIALFGDEGEHDWSVLNEEEFGPGHFLELEQAFGIRVVTRPAKAELTILPDEHGA